MVSYDIILFLNDNDTVEHVECWDFTGQNDRLTIWKEYVGRQIDSFLNIDMDRNSGQVSWMGMAMKYTKTHNVQGNGTIVYMTTSAGNTRLLEEVLDCLDEGIQVYDQNGTLVFCNRLSEQIEKTDRTKIVGKHLLDIYDLNEEFSTVLNTLKSREPVINRCDNFKNKNGEMITTMNSGFPLFVDEELIGAMVLVEDSRGILRKRQNAEVLDAFIKQGEKKPAGDRQKNYVSFKYYSFKDLIGETENFQEVISLARNVSERDCPVLIHGETGTGKELFAQSIHSASRRSNKEFVAVNCAAIPETLIEGIFFGTEKGTFTGSADRMGLFEQAEGGTLFLDEINSMNPHMQSKLLRVIQESKFRRVGGLRDMKCDVRIISSTNEEPFYAVENNRIRKDLYYRISTVTLNIPPLRERHSDIAILVKFFIDKLSRHYSKGVLGVTEATIDLMNGYDWPGNVRELLHVIEYAFNTMNGDMIRPADLPKYLSKTEEPDRKISLQSGTLKSKMDSYEKEEILRTLKRCGNNVTKAADELGLVRQSLQYRIRKYGL